MAKLVTSISINLLIGKVYVYVPDLRNIIHWMTGVIPTDMTSPEPVKVGSTNKLDINTLGMLVGVAQINRVRLCEKCDRPANKDKSKQTALVADQGSTVLSLAVQVAARHWREGIVLAILTESERYLRDLADYPATPVSEV